MKKNLLSAIFLLITFDLYAQTCNITNISPVNFGNYDVANNIPTDSTGSVTILCEKNTNIEIFLDRGLYSTNFSTRNMKHASLNEFLSYNLYTNQGRTTIWGDGTGGSSTVKNKINKNKPETFIIYGRIFPMQNVSVGSYEDRIIVTILP